MLKFLTGTVFLHFAFAVFASPVSIKYSGVKTEVDVYDFMDVGVRVGAPDVKNPFVDAFVEGTLTDPDGVEKAVDGFCDSEDGSVYRIRFMPQKPGVHKWEIRYRQGEFERRETGEFSAIDRGRKGILRLDPEYPEHFIWAGTGQHYFWNGTTTYYLMGWRDDEVIRRSIDRLARLGVNRLRVLVYGRNNDRPWGQPVRSTEDFSLYLNPWPAEHPDNIENPGFDLTRFNVEYWQKYERMLEYAREKDVIVSVIFFIGGQVLPTPFAAYSEDELRFYRYGVARLAAFSNVTWDLGNEHNFHREVPKWCDWLGPKVKEWDPYDHLLSAHNIIYRTEGATWNDMQLIQRWDAGQNAFMLEERRKQRATGRIIPQINEEYGYEDLWEKFPGQRAAETRRLLAWEIAMAGCYQTTGETAERGVGFEPDTGGGWVSGRGDDSMTMLQGYSHMVEFMTAFDWWKCDPDNGLAGNDAFCLSEPGRTYAVYMPESHPVSLDLPEGAFRVRAFQPMTGEWFEWPVTTGPHWAAAPEDAPGGWAILLEKGDGLVDRTAPRPIMVEAMDGGARLKIRFSEGLDLASARDVRHYRVSGAVEVTAVEEALADRGEVIIRVEGIRTGQDYTLFVRGICDQASDPNRMTEEMGVRFRVSDPEAPLVYLAFDSMDEGQTRNAGRLADEAPWGYGTENRPVVVEQPSPGGGEGALLLGKDAGPYAVDVGKRVLDGLKGLKSFTISGWVNCMNSETGAGGNRIVTTENNGGDGFDLVFLRDGRLQLSVNEWPDGLPTHSSAGMIPVDPEGSPGNWRFFAVTYDSTKSDGHVRFYFAGPEEDVKLDAIIDYQGAAGAVGHNIGPLAVGNFNTTIRAGHEDRMFRGMIDEIRIHGSRTDASGALSLEQIQRLFNGE